MERPELSDELYDAAYDGDIRAIEVALASGTDVNDLGTCGISGRFEFTMLTVAAENCQHEVAKLLLEKGADPNLERVGWRYSVLPALHKAGDAQMIDLLVAHGAEVDPPPIYSHVALVDQAYDDFAKVDCVRALLRHGADFTLEDPNERHTPLSAARENLQHFCTERPGGEAIQGRFREMIDLLTAVEAAGSWKRYVREPVVQLLCLRYLCLAGRARPPAYNTLLVRLFGAPPVPNAGKARRAANILLPNEVVAHIFTFWNRRA